MTYYMKKYTPRHVVVNFIDSVKVGDFIKFNRTEIKNKHKEYVDCVGPVIHITPRCFIVQDENRKFRHIWKYVECYIVNGHLVEQEFIEKIS